MRTRRTDALLWGLGLTAALMVAGQARATTLSCGNGEHSADVYLEFSDGAVYEFEVFFEGQTTGLGLMDIIESETSLTTIRDDLGWGVFIDGISYDGHLNADYLGGENWWHYWTRDSDSDGWETPMIGAVDRIVIDGDGDAWVYGRAGAPVPEPGSLVLMALAMPLVQRKRNL